MSDEKPTKGDCFVIAPIGADGSPERTRSDQVFRHIIEPTVNPKGYRPVRADHLGKPGLITSQVVDNLLDAPLVIADLTGGNPNVFYELAIRHAARKPVVLLVNRGEKLPFDVAPSRTIHFDYRDLDSVADCIAELGRQIDAAEEDPSNVDSPVSVAVDVRALRDKGDATSKALGQILDQLQDLQSRVQALSSAKPTISTFQPPVYSLADLNRAAESNPHLVSMPGGDRVLFTGPVIPIDVDPTRGEDPKRRKSTPPG